MPLESTASPTVSAAIDSGAASAESGILPGSEASARANDVVAGLKAGAPSSLSPSSAQLSLITAFAKGAATAAVAPGGSTFTSAQHTQLQSAAQGAMEGLVAAMPASPSTGFDALAQRLAQGAFQGLIPQLGPSAGYEAWMSALQREALLALTADAQAAAAGIGSPALSDITDYAATLASTQAGALPVGATGAQLDAVGSFGGGEMGGMTDGVLASFPSGVPAPQREQLRGWISGAAKGHQGTPPWSASSAKILAAYGKGVVDTVPGALAGGSNQGAQVVLEMAAYAQGIAQGGYELLPAIPPDPNTYAGEAQAYAESVAAPAAKMLAGTDPTKVIDTSGLKAWSHGLATGLGTIRGAALDSTRAERAWLSGLANATASFPASMTAQQQSLVGAFAAGVTTKLGERTAAIAKAAVGDQDSALLVAMATGLGQGAAALAQSTSPAPPGDAQALGDGFSSGFLETKDPDAVWGDVDNLGGATTAYMANVVPDSLFGPAIAAALAAATSPVAALQEYGAIQGGAPVEWAAQKGAAVSDQGFATKADLQWIGEFAGQSAQEEVPIVVGLPDLARGSALDYIGAVAANATAFPVKKSVDGLTTSQIPHAAKAFAATLTKPTGWIHPADPSRTERAAKKALTDTIANASTIQRFADPKYADFVVGTAQAIASGVKSGGPHPAGPLGNLTTAWISPVFEAALNVPVDALKQDMSSRLLWTQDATTAATLVASNATQGQIEGTVAYANAVLAWLNDTSHAPLPDFTGMPLPLAVWANATVQGALGHLPPAPSDGERGAYVNYSLGVAQAVLALPTPDAMTWTPQQIAAMQAYVGGIAAGAGSVAKDLYQLANATNCLDNCSGGGNQTGGCTSDCPTPPPTCDASCLALAYSGNVRNWTENLTIAGLQQMPDTTPTQAGILAVQRWATAVLADQGVQVAPDAPGVAYNGPRGPAYDFAAATGQHVQGFANDIALGYGPLVTLDPSTPTSLLTGATAWADPLTAWGAAMEDAVAGYWLDPAHAPSFPQQPGVPTGPGAPPVGDDPATQQWVDAMWQAIPESYQHVVTTSPPDTKFLVDYASQLDYLAFHAAMRGGLVALDGARANATKAGHQLTPQTGPLDSFAAGLVGTFHASLADPETRDANAFAAYIQGVAQGGARTIADAAATIPAQQLPAIAAYAATLGNAGWIAAPPTPIDPAAFTTPASTDSVGGDGADPTPAQPQDDPTADALANLQAHGAGLAAAVLAAPADPSAFQPTIQYVQALQASGALLPPVRPDAGYPARLSAWEAAQTKAALGTPPGVSPDRLAPTPNGAMLASFLESFAGQSAWGLAAQASAAADTPVAWASAAVSAVAGTQCPAGELPACADVGRDVGAGLGDALPQLPAQPDVTGMLSPFVQGAIPAIPGGVAPPVAADAIDGALQGLAPKAPPPDQTQAYANAAIAATLAQAPTLAQGNALPLAQSLARALLTYAPPLPSAKNVAMGAAAYAASQLPSGAPSDPATIEALVAKSFTQAADSATPAIEIVGEGGKTFRNDTLDGSAIVPAMGGVTIHLLPAAAQAPGQQWSVSWAGGDVPLAAQNGIFVGAIPADALAKTPSPGGLVQLTAKLALAGGQSQTFQRDGKPWAFVPDRDLPTASLTGPAAPTTRAIALAWGGSDGDSGVASYRLQKQDGGGAWTDVEAATKDTAFSFTGEPGHTYQFRVAATDLAGHEGAFSAPIASKVPPGVSTPENPPKIDITSPAGGSFGASIPVSLAVTDADGNAPAVKVCLRPQDAGADGACLHEGTEASFTIDTTGVPDGQYRLHAIATDGSATTDALSAPFTLDRTGPALRGLAYDPDRSLVLLGADADATSANVEVRDGSGHLVKSLPLARGADGAWSAPLSLAQGTYRMTASATDAAGNAATITRDVTVGAPTPKPTHAPSVDGSPSGSGGAPSATPTPAPPASAPTPEKRGIPAPSFALALVLAFALALVVRRRR